jgi:hypothetical protein
VLVLVLVLDFGSIKLKEAKLILLTDGAHKLILLLMTLK